MKRWDYIKGYEDQINSGDAIAIVWCIDDVYCTAEDMGFALTEEQARNILGDIDHRHDACIGISWDVIQCHIEMLEWDLKDEGKRLTPVVPCPKCEENPLNCCCDS